MYYNFYIVYTSVKILSVWLELTKLLSSGITIIYFNIRLDIKT